MKRLQKLYPGYFKALFMRFNFKEKRSAICLFALLLANASLYSYGLSKNPFIYLIQGFVVTLNIFVLAKLLFSNTREFNKRVVKENYKIDILEYTKAFQIKLFRAIFISNIVLNYAKYEDLMADYDEEFRPNNPDIKKKFWTLFMLLTGLIAFFGNFLLNETAIKTKLIYLIFVVGFILVPILVVSLFLIPILRDRYKDRYKKDKTIIAILNEIKNTIDQLPPKYVATTDLKILVLNSGLIDNTFLVLFSQPQIQKRAEQYF